MKKICLVILFGLYFLCLFAANASAHCQIPCGIYDDGMRIKMISEHIATIEKAMTQIMALEKKDDPNYNQLVRWIMNKEEHADEIQHIVSEYFMTQRIRPDTKDYEKKLGLLHQMLIYSMKCKQTTDVKNANKLREIVKDFEKIYFQTK